MKGKQLVTVLVVLILLGGIALFLHQRNERSWSQSATSAEGKVLSFPLNDVSHITIKGNSAELDLVKKGDAWRVAERFDYPADFDKVASFIRRLWELHPAQDVRVGKSQFARLQLTRPGNDPNSGTLVELKRDDKPLAALLLGKKQLRDSEQSFGGGIPVGRYVAPQDGSNRVFVISEGLDEIQTKPEQWLSHDFIKVEKPKSIAIAGLSPGMNWKLVRENDSTPWKFSEPKRGEELDPAKATMLSGYFANPTFADILDPKTPPSESGLDKPSTVRFETFDNFVYDLRIGKLMGNNYPVVVSVTAALPKERTPGKDEKPEDKPKFDQEFQATQKLLTDKLNKEKKTENWIYLVPKGTVEQIVKDRSALLAEKKPPTSPALPVRAPSPKKPK